MKKLMLSALALGAMTAVAMAGEPVKLTSSQLDVVSAGNPCSKFKGKCFNSNFNWTSQTAVAVGGCNGAVCVAGGFGANGNASAINSNETEQEISGD
jgi:hypothetical protein